MFETVSKVILKLVDWLLEHPCGPAGVVLWMVLCVASWMIVDAAIVQDPPMSRQMVYGMMLLYGLAALAGILLCGWIRKRRDRRKSNQSDGSAAGQGDEERPVGQREDAS